MLSFDMLGNLQTSRTFLSSLKVCLFMFLYLRIALLESFKIEFLFLYLQTYKSSSLCTYFDAVFQIFTLAESLGGFESLAELP